MTPKERSSVSAERERVRRQIRDLNRRVSPVPESPHKPDGPHVPDIPGPSVQQIAEKQIAKAAMTPDPEPRQKPEPVVPSPVAKPTIRNDVRPEVTREQFDRLSVELARALAEIAALRNNTPLGEDSMLEYIRESGGLGYGPTIPVGTRQITITGTRARYVWVYFTTDPATAEYRTITQDPMPDGVQIYDTAFLPWSVQRTG